MPYGRKRNTFEAIVRVARNGVPDPRITFVSVTGDINVNTPEEFQALYDALVTRIYSVVPEEERFKDAPIEVQIEAIRCFSTASYQDLYPMFTAERKRRSELAAKFGKEPAIEDK